MKIIAIVTSISEIMITETTAPTTAPSELLFVLILSDICDSETDEDLETRDITLNEPTAIRDFQWTEKQYKEWYLHNDKYMNEI